MNIVIAVAREILGMFLGDARLTAAILALVAFVTLLVSVVRIAPLMGGILLLSGCLGILIEAAFREARRRRLR